MNFSHPWAFLLIFLLPLAFLRFRRSRTGQGHPFSASVTPPLTARMVIFKLLPALRAVAFLLLITALAGPQSPLPPSDPEREGIAIMMVLDRSGSMGALMDTGKETLSRLDVVKRVFADFATTRNHDLMGLVTFARFPETLFPLSASTDTLPSFIDTIELPASEREDGTAMGDAMALGIARLKTAKPSVKSRILVLLTDGLSNAGEATPFDAAKTAAEAGIPVYAIGFSGNAYQLMPGGTGRIPLGTSFDRATLLSIASQTGGEFFSADSEASLKEAYATIDSLERSRLRGKTEGRHEELFWIFASLAFALFLTERVLTLTGFRRMA